MKKFNIKKVCKVCPIADSCKSKYSCRQISAEEAIEGMKECRKKLGKEIYEITVRAIKDEIGIPFRMTDGNVIIISKENIELGMRIKPVPDIPDIVTLEDKKGISEIIRRIKEEKDRFYIAG